MVHPMKSRATSALRAADAASSEHSLMPTHMAPSAKASGWVIVQKSTRGVLAAFGASAKPLCVAGLVMGLVWLALKFVGRFQLWMTAAGVVMVILSVASAYQEVTAKDVLQATTDMEYGGEDCAKVITIPTAPEAAPKPPVPAPQPVVASSPAKDVAVDVAPSPAPAKALPPRRNSCTLELGRSNNSVAMKQPVAVVHSGTVIDIQGSRGLIIPHRLQARSKASAAGSNNIAGLQLPLVISFELSLVLAALRQQLSVGTIVEFSLMPETGTTNAAASKTEAVMAMNVRPLASDEEEIARSRSALQTCKQAREQSFAKAMGELKMISPRNVPVKHPVDLIKYAEFLDDDDDDVPPEDLF